MSEYNEARISFWDRKTLRKELAAQRRKRIPNEKQPIANFYAKAWLERAANSAIHGCGQDIIEKQWAIRAGKIKNE